MTQPDPSSVLSVHVHQLPWHDMGDVLAVLEGEPWLACLDSGSEIMPRGRWTILCRDPVHVVEAHAGRCFVDRREQAGDALEILRGLIPAFACPDGMPFVGGAIGFADYRFGQRTHGLSTRHDPDPQQPEFAAGIYDHAIIMDRLERRAWLTGYGTPDVMARRRREVMDLWGRVVAHAPLPKMPDIQFTMERSARGYRRAVAQACDYIAAGDIFQVNITARMWGARPPGLSPIAAYRALRVTSAAPFGAFLSCGPDFALLSASPERFVALDVYGVMRTRPIKGTAPRDPDPVRDRQRAQDLRLDEKECAENLMIVDLMRNDLGQLARIGSVSVPELFNVEHFTHVHHLVSEVQATLLPGHDAIDLLRVTLPPGSVTGAPKHRAMQIIDELEGSARGPYCGVVFRIGGDGAMDSSVIIRTLVMTRAGICAAAGGGITILSDPQKEYEEMCLKVSALLSVFGNTSSGEKEHD
ncbi:anthranilate synthase component I family protein [Novacetimonas hansenii]|uniref:Anthranilate synthase component I family protein n=1 Tax=Novacetimonas hansenii TaxID=436 RepID=A0AAW5ETL5_NOVHA|nr:anthranilate synthase component I family protein [Novacetimonas hansenii]